MRTLELPLSNDAYTTDKSAAEFIRVQLDGGAGRYGIDLFGVSDLVALSFVCSPSDYDYLKSFYNEAIRSGEEFLINLMIDRFELRPYACRFMPQSFRITGTKGLNTFVSATVEATPYEDNPISDSDILVLFDEFGENYAVLFPIYEDILNTIVNVKLPKDF